jgi:hypothetical protein
MQYLKSFLLLICLIVLAAPCLGSVCELPNIGGTAEFPPPCPDGYVGVLNIIDGLPPGSTITGPARLTGFSDPTVYPGGNLGGERFEFLALLEWTASGTGDLAGFNRLIGIPVACIVDTELRNPGNSVQIFNTDFSFLSGNLVGDPDFDQLTILAGTDNGMPCPGTTRLDELPSGDFNVDSFFDITYQIDFNGCPGSMLEDFSGSTVDTQRFQAGAPYYISGVEGNVIPALGILYQNKPNPFNPVTVISYELPAGGCHVAVDIFDVRGRHVCNLVNTVQTDGLKSVTWNGADGQGRRASSGVYFYTLKTANQTLVRKMAIIK